MFAGLFKCKIVKMQSYSKRPVAFVISSTNHGTMLVNRNDYHMVEGHGTYGVGHQLLNRSAHEPEEIDVVSRLLVMRRSDYGPGVVVLDCGANIGTHTIEWARLMYDWGSVLAFEAQERIFYALAGNITINNCFNARAIWAAVGEQPGQINVPEVNYLLPSSFGSLELKKKKTTEFIGQPVDYDKCQAVRMASIDELGLERLDFIKLDVEGMELDALKGAIKTIRNHRPQMMIERIKSNCDEISLFLRDLGYKIFSLKMDFLAVHENDPSLGRIEIAQ